MKQLSLKRKNLKKNIQLNDCITVLRRLIEGLSVSEGPYFIAIKKQQLNNYCEGVEKAAICKNRIFNEDVVCINGAFHSHKMP